MSEVQEELLNAFNTRWLQTSIRAVIDESFAAAANAHTDSSALGEGGDASTASESSAEGRKVTEATAGGVMDPTDDGFSFT